MFVTGLTLVVLITAFSNNHQETLKEIGLLLTSPENYMVYLVTQVGYTWLHSEVVGKGMGVR